MNAEPDIEDAARRGELCVGSARLPATIVELAAEGALLRLPIKLRAPAPQAVRIAGVGFLPVGAAKQVDDGLEIGRAHV